ncbi:acetyltransferase [Flavobacteriaceae bacterium F89]|uniref:Acetyltransferase n=1 Tax=Cerina litoralis TaxID=2874477 RepID=A0AAE3EVP5_9FLAO|nr:acetyltransferase [Cerina litoralis]MCG2461193.1 acetyltransferase [Cerina litoralis]
MQDRKTLNVLALYPERLNILLELANESCGFELFNVFKNMTGENTGLYVPNREYKVTFHNWYENKYSLDPKGCYALGVIGTRSKELVFNTFHKYAGAKKGQFNNLVHPTSYISNSARLDYGLQMGPLSSISVLTRVGFGVTIKRNCNIGHHCHIGNYATINPGVSISGFVTIGNNSLIGTGSIVKDGLKIGSNSIIGSGSNVVKDIPDNCVAYGNPCVVHRINE